MRNFVQPGVTLTLIAVAVLAAGDGVVTGSIFSVASNDAAIGEEFEGVTTGVFSLPKTAAVVVDAGDPAYFNAANGEVTNASAVGLYLIGSFADDAAGGDATGNVRLSGAPVFAVA